jgi:predicted transcriptional regulator
VKLSEEQAVRLDNVVKDFRIALKNSILYATNHPICNYSINNLKASLDKWLLSNERLNLGITQNHLFFDDESLKEKDDGYNELANYLHMRGLISLSIRRGIDAEELKDFLGLIKQDRKTIQTNGGIQKHLPGDRHIKIKEIDYTSLLHSARDETTTEDKKIWQFLFNVAEETKTGELPPSKVEFLADFFKDTKQSAKALNKVYREAASQLQDESSGKDIRNAIAQICQYLEKHSGEKAKDLRVKLMNVIAQLHPDLIHILFEQTVEGEENFDLAESITKDFSENYIAEFIESLITNEDTFNENLLKVFDKLTPGPSKANNVVSMVAERLFQKRIINPDTLSQLQMSIMEIFRKHPESDFMNQIYKITVDAVMNKKIDTLVYMAKLSPLINKFVQSMEEEQLKKEKIWLLLNILWLENSPEEFKRFTHKLLSVMPELLDSKDMVRIREIVEFFTEKIRPEQKNNSKLVAEIKEALVKITNKKTIDHIVSIIPEATQKDMEDIVYTLIRSEADCAKTLVDTFISEKNPAHRNKFWFIFSMMKNEIAREAVNRLEYGEPHVVKDLFTLLRECDPKKMHLAAKKLIGYNNSQIRWEALEVFNPKTDDETDVVLKIYKKEKNRAVKKKAAAVLLKTGNAETLNRLFRQCERDFFRPGNLLELVELSGNTRSQSAFPHLKKVFFKRVLFNTKRRDDLRAAVLTSAARIKTEEALKLVRLGLRDKSRRVREMSEIILKLDE